MKKRGGGGRNAIFKERGLDLSQLQPQNPKDGPPPRFPEVENPPIPSDLLMDDEELVKAHLDLVEMTRSRSPYFIDRFVRSHDIERYSDRLLSSSAASASEVGVGRVVDSIQDLQNLPQELHSSVKGGVARKRAAVSGKDLLDAVDKVAASAHKKVKTGAEGGQEGGEAGQEGEEVLEGEGDDEEEVEEENDYVDTYFDNGEEEVSEGDDEGAVY